MLKPLRDYVLVEIIKRDTGVITSTDVTETDQYGKVLAVGDGAYEFGQFIKPDVEVGDMVYWEAYAEGSNVPKEIRNKSQALIKASRIMAVEQ